MSTLLSVRIGDELKAKLEALAEATQRSKSFLAIEALERYVERESWQVAAIREGIRDLEDHGAIPDTEVWAWMESFETPTALQRPMPRKQSAK